MDSPSWSPSSMFTMVANMYRRYLKPFSFNFPEKYRYNCIIKEPQKICIHLKCAILFFFVGNIFSQLKCMHSAYQQKWIKHLLNPHKYGR